MENDLHFFGFENPLVQILLRELVINSHGIVESTSSSRASQMRVDDERPVMFANPNLLCHLDVPVARKKRSRTPKIIYKNSEDTHEMTDQKRSRFGEISNSVPVLVCSTKGEVETVGLQVAPPAQLHSNHCSNENSYLLSENPPQVKVFSLIEETDRLPDRCKLKPLSIFPEEIIHKELLHGLQEKEKTPNYDNFLHESQDRTWINIGEV